MGQDLSGFYFKILEYLSEYGINVDVDIADLVQGYFPNMKTTDIMIYSKEVDKIVSILNLLERSKFIKYSGNTDSSSLTSLFYKGGEYLTSITKEGWDCYYEHLLSKATIKSFKNQRIISISTLRASGIAIIISVISLCLKPYEPQPTIQMLPVDRQMKPMKQPTYPTHKTGDTTYQKK